jgi:hypothetical protein
VIELRRIPGDESGNLPTELSDTRNQREPASVPPESSAIAELRNASKSNSSTSVGRSRATLAAASAVNPKHAMSVTREPS